MSASYTFPEVKNCFNSQLRNYSRLSLALKKSRPELYQNDFQIIYRTGRSMLLCVEKSKPEESAW